jgi:predicted GNAT family acetyltransferase
MPWSFTNDVEEYVDHAWELLTANPMEQTVALTVIASLRAGRRWCDEEVLFGWHDARGAVLMTPPYELLLAVVPDDTLADLVLGLRGRGVQVPGVTGEVATAQRFADAWTTGWAVTMRQRLYALDTLRHPTPAPAGSPRPARSDDLDVVLAWLRAFQDETRIRASDVLPSVLPQIEDGRFLLWTDQTGAAVALAGRNLMVAGVARVGPVYTPPARRGRGYGTAVTAACTADALSGGAGHAVLFTDLANPTSNSIYQRIGYRAIGDRLVLRFD